MRRRPKRVVCLGLPFTVTSIIFSPGLYSADVAYYDMNRPNSTYRHAFANSTISSTLSETVDYRRLREVEIEIPSSPKKLRNQVIRGVQGHQRGRLR